MWPFNRSKTHLLEAGPIPPAGVVSPPAQDDMRQRRLAPPPQIDKYPIVIGGENLTGATISAAMRLCTMGWRYQFVDIVNELIENNPKVHGFIRRRIVEVACADRTVSAPKLREDHPLKELANEIAERFSEQFQAIPFLTQRIAQLAYGDIYGVSALENMWEPDGDGWAIRALEFIHPRRLNFPDPMSWEMHIYDQGLVGPGYGFMGPTTGLYGLPVTRFPYKFLTHQPAMNADYATRDGEARYLVFYLLLERMVLRATAQDLERVIRPWVLGYYQRQLPDGVKSNGATPEDISLLDDAIRAAGAGTLNGAVLPDTVKVAFEKLASATSPSEFISILHRAMAIGILGESFTSEPGPNGNLATAEIAHKDAGKVLRYSAMCLCDSLRYGLALPWMKLNYPDAPSYLAPVISMQTEDNDPKAIAQVLSGGKGVQGLFDTLDRNDTIERLGLKALSPEETQNAQGVAARRLVLDGAESEKEK